MRFDILTTFPELFSTTPPAALAASIPARAHTAGIAEWHASDIRAFADNKHDKTDDRPFGGGPGMVMTCQPIYDAVKQTEAADPRPATRILLTPQGTPLTQQIVEELATKPRLLLIAGHYEGIDERVIEELEPLELSLGDYVISGGELAALVLIDAIVRLLPGALGDAESALNDSFAAPPGTDAIGEPLSPKAVSRLNLNPDQRLLDCPHYTRPRVWKGREVPEILLSGDHQAIAEWRLQQMINRTRQRRPDLFEDTGA